MNHNREMAKEAGRRASGEHWIAGAVKHPGALRATAAKLGMIHGDEKLSGGDLSALAARAKRTGNDTLAKRVALAKTFAKMRGAR